MGTTLRYFISFLLLWGMSMPSFAQAESFIDQFSATKNGLTVLLSWRTTAGNTCNGIGIFRSADSVDFVRIGLIPGICGSEAESLRYSFADTLPLLNTPNYYRLEFGGVGESHIISIDLADVGEQGFQIRPHPLVNEGRIYFQNDTYQLHTLRLYSPDGQLVLTAQTTDDAFDIAANHLPDGVYVFNISSSETGSGIVGQAVVQSH